MWQHWKLTNRVINAVKNKSIFCLDHPCSRKTHLLTNRKPLRCPRFRQSVLLWGAPKLPLILTRKIVRFYRSWKSGSEKTLWSTRPQGFQNSTLIIPPRKRSFGRGNIGFTLSVRLSVCLSPVCRHDFVHACSEK